MTSLDGAHEIETCLSNILHGVLDVIKSPLPLWRVMRTPARAAIEDDRKQEIERGLIETRRRQLVADGGELGASKKDLLGLLLKARDSDRSVNFADEDLTWDVHDIIFAGHETTASALAAALFLIAGSPRVLAKIQEELRIVLPGGRPPQYADLDNLEYLDMVLNEALRLYPPTALIGRIAKEADVVDGYVVPQAATFSCLPMLWAGWSVSGITLRSSRPELVAKRHPMANTRFGSGPRVCLGARMATMEAKAVLAVIFQQYTFKRTQEELVVDYDSTVSFKSGMDMLINKRTSSTLRAVPAAK